MKYKVRFPQVANHQRIPTKTCIFSQNDCILL